jgi:hypothetical protein
VFLTPPAWKRLAEIPPGAENKDLARTRAIARWPAQADLFTRKCDVDRAEASHCPWRFETGGAQCLSATTCPIAAETTFGNRL